MAGNPMDKRGEDQPAQLRDSMATKSRVRGEEVSWAKIFLGDVSQSLAWSDK